jgi:uncharacterized protein (DUF433 family)
MHSYAKSYEVTNYSMVEAGLYLRLKPQEVRRWTKEGILCSSNGGISFFNLLELHILKCLRKEFGLSMQRIRRALDEYNLIEHSDHPFLDPRMETDGIHLFLHDGDEYMNLNRPKQRGIPQILSSYLRRIDHLADGGMTFYPFVVGQDLHEPRSIQISPSIAFGRPVLADTGIATDVIAGRFRARDSVTDLAEEYGVPVSMVEDAIRWELPYLRNL